MKPNDEYRVCSLEEAEEFARKREMKPHKHKDLIIAWANGAKIERKTIRTGMNINEPIISELWVEEPYPFWSIHEEYRVKPAPKPNYYKFYRISYEGVIYPRGGGGEDTDANLIIRFNGETGAPEEAEVIK